MADAIEIPITESVERWSDVTLDDGTRLRVKASVISVSRIEGRFDDQGNPMYAINSAPQVVILEVGKNADKKSN